MFISTVILDSENKKIFYLSDKGIIITLYSVLLAVGAGGNHHTELSEEIYTDAQTKIYVDAMSNAKSELATLNAPIVGEVGDIINGAKQPPQSGIIIFHSMGRFTHSFRK